MGSHLTELKHHLPLCCRTGISICESMDMHPDTYICKHPVTFYFWSNVEVQLETVVMGTRTF